MVLEPRTDYRSIGYDGIHGVVRIFCTCKGLHREMRMNQGGTAKLNALVLIVITIMDGSFF